MRKSNRRVWLILISVALSVGIVTSYLDPGEQAGRDMASLANSGNDNSVPQRNSPSSISDIKNKIRPKSFNSHPGSWAASLPEVEVIENPSKTRDYKRVYGIIERDLSREEVDTKKLNPKSPEGLKKIKEAIGMSIKSMDLQWGRDYPADEQGLTTTRLNVVNNGIPVFGSEVIVNQRQTPSGLREELVKDVIKEVPKDLATKPALDAEKALEFSRSDAQKAADVSELDAKLLSAKLVYYPGEKTLNLAWHLTVQTESTTQEEDSQFGQWLYIIDSKNGEVLNKANAIHTEAPTEKVFQASGPGGNALGDRPWNEELDVTFDSALNLYQMNTSRLVTIDQSTTTFRTSYDDWYYAQFPVKLRLLPVANSDSLNAFLGKDLNNAQGYVEITLNFLKSFGFNSIDEKGFKLISFVNWPGSDRSGHDNAFWMSLNNVMVYGNGKTKFLNMAGDLSVVAHEVNHGFTQFHSGLWYTGQSGGLNESFSDIAGVATKYFSGEKDNFLIGDKVINPNGSLGNRGFLRDMCNPHSDGRSLDNFASYLKAAEVLPKESLGVPVHSSSGIMNKVFCRFSKRLSTRGDPEGAANKEGVLKAARLFFDANKTKWSPLSTFTVAAMGTIRSAKALDFTETELKYLSDSWLEVGIDSTPVPSSTFKATIFNMDKANISRISPESGTNVSCNNPKTQCSIIADNQLNQGRLAINFHPVTGSKIQRIVGCDVVDIGELMGASGILMSSLCEVTLNSRETEIYLEFGATSCRPSLIETKGCGGFNWETLSPFDGVQKRQCKTDGSGFGDWGSCSKISSATPIKDNSVTFGTSSLGYSFIHVISRLDYRDSPETIRRGKVVTYQGKPVSENFPGGGWLMKSIWAKGNTYQAFWTGPNNTYATWKLNAEGEYLSSETITLNRLLQLEIEENLDIDKNGTIGTGSFTSASGIKIGDVETGTTQLGYSFRQGTKIQQVIYQASSGREQRFTSATFPGGGWTLRAVWAKDAGYLAFWLNTNGSFVIWKLNAQGELLSPEALTAPQIASLENQLNFDLDASGVIGGGAFTPAPGVKIGDVETGTTQLGYSFRQGTKIQQVIYQASSGKEQRFTSATFPGGGWTLRAVWAKDAGYLAFWLNTNGSFVIWKLNAQGELLSPEALTAPQIASLENQLSFDLNNNKLIGR